MKNILQYRGYFTKIEYSVEDRLLYGKIEGIKDLVNFESESVEEIEKEFKNAVDDYLELCQALGQDPDKTYSGTFNVRISPALHRAVALQAIKTGDSLNNTVEKAIDSFINDNTKQTVEAIWSVVSERQYNAQPNSCASSSKSFTFTGWPYARKGFANA